MTVVVSALADLDGTPATDVAAVGSPSSPEPEHPANSNAPATRPDLAIFVLSTRVFQHSYCAAWRGLRCFTTASAKPSQPLTPTVWMAAVSSSGRRPMASSISSVARACSSSW